MRQTLALLLVSVNLCALSSCTWLDHLPSPGLERELAQRSQSGLGLIRSLDHDRIFQFRRFDDHTETLSFGCCPQRGAFDGLVHNRFVMKVNPSLPLVPTQSIWDEDKTDTNAVRSGGVQVVVLDANGRLLARSDLRIYGAGITLSPDGTQFAFKGVPSGNKFEQTGIYVASFRGTQVRKLMPALVPLGDPATLDWSPDGRNLLVSRIGEISRIDLATGRITKLADGSKALWSPRGTWISFVTPERDSALLEVATGQVSLIDPGRHTGTALEWSPDGRYLLVLEAEGSHEPYGCLWIYRVADGAFTPIPGYGVGGPHAQWLQRDGTLVGGIGKELR